MRVSETVPKTSDGGANQKFTCSGSAGCNMTLTKNITQFASSKSEIENFVCPETTTYYQSVSMLNSSYLTLGMSSATGKDPFSSTTDLFKLAGSATESALTEGKISTMYITSEVLAGKVVENKSLQGFSNSEMQQSTVLDNIGVLLV